MLRKLLVAVGVAAAVAGAGPVAWGQGAPGNGETRVTPQGMREQAATVSVAFKGGSAVDYAKAVQAASGAKRVVVMPGCEGYVMPAVELSDVTLEGALAPLEFAVAGPGNPFPLRVSRKDDVYVVSPAGALEVAEDLETVVFSLSQVLDSGGVSAEDVLTAVETALQLAGGAAQGGQGDAAVRYHPETRLLMVRGTDEARDAVAQVLQAVQETAVVSRQGLAKGEEARRELDELRAELAAAVKGVEEAARYAEEVQQVAKSGGASPLEVLNAREQVIQRERHRTEIESRVRILEERLERQRVEREAAQAAREAGSAGRGGAR